MNCLVEWQKDESEVTSAKTDLHQENKVYVLLYCVWSYYSSIIYLLNKSIPLDSTYWSRSCRWSPREEEAEESWEERRGAGGSTGRLPTDSRVGERQEATVSLSHSFL